jgi:hypothetical protein
MDVLDSKSSEELARSLLAEVAKASNELRCAQGDVNKAQARLQFCIAVINSMIQRQEIK